MYIRKVTSKHAGKTYTKYVLVESIRTPSGPRQRVICSLGDLRPRPAAEWLELVQKVESALQDQLELSEKRDGDVEKVVRRIRTRGRGAPLERVVSGSTPPGDVARITIDVDRVRTELHREAGTVHVGYQMWKRLGLDMILSNVGMSQHARMLACAMTLNRLIHPCSEHAMPDWIRRTALGDILGVEVSELTDDALYRNLDALHPNRAKIEKSLAEHERTLFNLDHTVFLYDLTSTYFEGQAALNPKAKRGYSRDHRPDCKQVVVGLVLNRDGFPLAHEIYDGNTQDRTTVAGMLDLLDARVGLQPGQLVVVDRGMAYDENLVQITSRGLHYLIAARQPERDRWLADFDDEHEFEPVIRIPSPLNPAQVKSAVKVKLRRTESGTHVLCVSDGRVLKDRAIREKHETRLLADLEKFKTRVAGGSIKKEAKIHEAIGRIKERYPRVARYYVMSYDAETKAFTYVLDIEKQRRAEKLDGSYLLRTDRKDLSADEAWRTYVLLARVENAFRAMKSPLEERPIFHQLQHRVETHIFLCVLAYHLLIAIEKTLLDQGVHTSWATLRETLKTHQVCTIVMPSLGHGVLRIRRGSNPEPAHVEIYQRLAIPSQVIRPVKTWGPPETGDDCSDQKKRNVPKS
jgi:transposase